MAACRLAGEAATARGLDIKAIVPQLKMPPSSVHKALSMAA
jgi:hypothetical protein